jgi:ParB family chromosome partitioning protein
MTDTLPESGDEMRDVPLEDIDPCISQSREYFDEEEIRRLADDIKANGQLQAGVAWLDPGRGRYVLICGERRWRALKIAGKRTMALRIIRGNVRLGQMLQWNLAENIQRSSLNAIERGKAFRRLMQLENLTATEAASRMNVSNATVSRDLSLLDLPESLQARIASGELPPSVAAVISRVGDDETRRQLADQYGHGEKNRADITAAVNGLLHPEEKAKKPRLALKLDGLSISVTAGKPDRLNVAGVLSVLERVCKAARGLKDGGKSDVAELAQALRAT